jgi:hypothetical protein
MKAAHDAACVVLMVSEQKMTRIGWWMMRSMVETLALSQLSYIKPRLTPQYALFGLGLECLVAEGRVLFFRCTIRSTWKTMTAVARYS